MPSDRDHAATARSRGGCGFRVDSVLSRRDFGRLLFCFVVVLLVVDHCQVYSEPARAENRSRTLPQHPRLPPSPHHHRRRLRCTCTTQHCLGAEGQNSCFTQYKCFTQFLDRGDGSDPITRGCISGNTPLLCENRLPASITRHRWPRLICCDGTDFCNSEGQQVWTMGVLDAQSPLGPQRNSTFFRNHAVAAQANLSDTISRESKDERVSSLLLLLKSINVKSTTPSATSDVPESEVSASDAIFSRASPNKAFSRFPVVICFVIGGFVCLAAVFSLGFRVLRRTNGISVVNGEADRSATDPCGKIEIQSDACKPKELTSTEVQLLKIPEEFGKFQCFCHD